MVDSWISLEGSNHADPEMRLLALVQTEVSEHPSTVRKPLQIFSSTDGYLCLSCLQQICLPCPWSQADHEGLANCQASKSVRLGS